MFLKLVLFVRSVRQASLRTIVFFLLLPTNINVHRGTWSLFSSHELLDIGSVLTGSKTSTKHYQKQA